jgi:hypothetical protein
MYDSGYIFVIYGTIRFLESAHCPADTNTKILDTTFKFKVCKSLHHHMIQIDHQPDATTFPVYYPEVYLQLNMFWAFSCPSSGAQ